jgi:hypothetical protein
VSVMEVSRWVRKVGNALRPIAEARSGRASRGFEVTSLAVL